MELASAAAQIIPVWPDSDDSTRAAVDKVLAARVRNPADFLRTSGGGGAQNA